MVKMASVQLHVMCCLYPFLDRKTLCTITNALVTSQMDYCNKFSMGLPLKNIYMIQLVKNRVEQTVVCAPRRTQVKYISVS